MLNSCGVDDVIVNPETKRHVRIEFEVKDSTTRHVGVTLTQTVAELYVNTTKENVGDDVVDSVRSASDEHVNVLVNEWSSMC